MDLSRRPQIPSGHMEIRELAVPLTSVEPRPAADGFSQLLRDIEPAREAIERHGIYMRVSDVASLRLFMSNHVFAVWDFMTLLKQLQRRLTCVDLPWLPPQDTTAARLINEIVLNEETDEVAPGRHMGHFHLYLAAMQEVDADSRPIRDLVAALRQGATVEATLARLLILPTTRQFVLDTLRLAQGATHEVAAAFLLGREDLVPVMFARLLRVLEQSQVRCESFRCYLDRHIGLDAEEHGPMARRLLSGLCGSDARRWREATVAAKEAIASRLRLWDGILAAVGQ
jgi:hypothetical protein